MSCIKLPDVPAFLHANDSAQCDCKVYALRNHLIIIVNITTCCTFKRSVCSQKSLYYCQHNYMLHVVSRVYDDQELY